MQAVLVHGIFAILKIAFILFGGISLFFEEAQYWLWSEHLDLSYYSKPPLIAYANYLSTGIFGDTEIGIRINAILCGFLTALIIYRLSERMTKNPRIAFWSSAILLALPYFWLISFFFMTDSLVTLFWTWAIYSFYMASGNRRMHWIWTGIAVGLGMLSKYVMVLFWPMAFIYLLLFRRREFRRPYLYLSMLLSAIFLIPVLYWNYLHDWVSVRHVIALASGHGEGPSMDILTSLKHLLEYIGGQLGLWLIVFIGTIVSGFHRLLKRRLDHRDIWLVMPVFLILWFFGALSLITRIEVNWTFFALPPMAVYIAGILTKNRRPIGIRIGIVTFLMLIMLMMPLLGRQFNYPASLNPLKRVMGWEQFNASVIDLMDEYDRNVVLVGDSYKTASMLTFYLPGHPHVHDFSPNRRMNQFDIWKEDGIIPSGLPVLFIGEGIHGEEMFADNFHGKQEEMILQRPYNREEFMPYQVLIFDSFNLPEKGVKEAF